MNTIIRRKRLSVLLLVIGILAFTLPVYGQVSEDVEIIGAVGYNARTVALGGCLGAITSDVDTIFLNPAGIGRFRQQEVNVSYHQWDNGMSYESVAYITPLNAMTLGVSAVYQNPTGSVPSIDEFSSRNLGVTLTAGKRFDDIMLGVNVKGMQEEIGGETSNSVVVDFAGLYNIGFAGMTVGFGVQNIGSRITTSSWGGELPFNFNLGGTYSALDDTLFMGLDMNRMIDGGYLLNSGVEYVPTSFLALRIGYRAMLTSEGDVSSFNRLSGGVGLNISKLHIDYTYVYDGLASYDQMVSVKFKVKMEPFGKTTNSKYNGYDSTAVKKGSKKKSCITIDGVTMCLYND